ncbi:MAG: sulfite exporter TauE/SafE family protein, partial [Gammaproteobacteria bacterium]
MTELPVTMIAAWLAVGAGAGIIAGLLGLGGGIVIVPALLYLFILQGMPESILMHLAVATSLATIVFTSLVSAWAHHRHQAVLWPAVLALAPGIVLGSIAGALLTHHLPSHTLRSAFGVFEILVGLQIGFGFKPGAHRALPGRGGMLLAGGGIGAVSTVLGIGGGTLTVPFLLWCNVHIRNAVATSSACGLPIAAVGAGVLIIAGSTYPGLPSGTSGYVY